MTDEEALAIAHQVLEYAEQLTNASKSPDIPAPFANDPKFLKYHENTIALRNIIYNFSKGDLSTTINMKGFVAGACKAIQANLRHMTWVAQQIEKGDYTQRIDFLGEFSDSFNNMAVKLKTTIDDLQQKEEALTELAISLQQEAQKRSAVLSELKKSEQRFKMLANHDPLTGLFNRRAFFTSAEMTVKNAQSLKQQCCICMLDVDFFKQFNDAFGHQEGDRALQHVAHICQRNLRTTDIIGRYGGEEFVILFYMAAEQCYETVERLRRAVEENLFTLENGHSTQMTASFGISVISPIEGGDNAEKLRLAIARADAALYTAKTQGRNRTCMDLEEEPAISSTAVKLNQLIEGA
ncbi:MAG: diguanylate cyclase [Syntrophorhabdaceae bacterium]|nr:diguanylate cyclase [Syntrophorhabdaceae bacterium]